MRCLELEDLARQIDSLNAQARAMVENHPASSLTTPTPNGGWSVAECLDHIAKTLDAYLPGLRTAVAENQSRKAEGPFHYGLLARTFLWIIEPPVRMRVRAPTMFAPRPQPDIQSALTAFVESHNRLQELLPLADGLDLAGIRVVSPANEKIKLPLGAAIGVLTAHARRHLWQARRILNES